MHGVIFRGRRYDTGDRLDYIKAIVQLASARDDLGPGLVPWLREFADSIAPASVAPVEAAAPSAPAPSVPVLPAAAKAAKPAAAKRERERDRELLPVAGA